MSLLLAWKGGYDGEAGWWLKLQPEREELARLKQAIPHGRRRYDPDRKLWWIAGEPMAEWAVQQIWPVFERWLSAVELPLEWPDDPASNGKREREEVRGL